MAFAQQVFGGALPPTLGSQNANQAITGLQDTASGGNNFMNSYGSSGMDAFGSGVKGLNSGLNNLTPVANWFQTIMGGNKAATLNQMQPQIQQIQGGLNTGLQTASTLNPRGGGRSGTLFDLPFEAQKDVAGQYAAARAGAPAGLQSAATAQGALGSSLAGAGTAAGGVGAGYGNVADSANNNLLNYGLNQGAAYNKQMNKIISDFTLGLISP